ncbi:MAG: methionyl-tRNA formyltransferase [Bacteroidetes bacterium]|nr:methionyl-tRNA formyltransferase [Bacteroidota bacterium]
MGTAGFAVPTLEILVQEGYVIQGVITAPDKPAGRGRKISQSPVKIAALRHGLTVLQPVNLKDPEFLAGLKNLQPDLQVVVAFRMLPESVWALPPLGTINLHASLLPQYRGAAPINHVIMNGEHRTGVTTFIIDKEIDTGHILLRESTSIGPHETAGELHDRLMTMGAHLVLKTLKELQKGHLKATRQEELEEEKSPLKKAPKIFKEDCQINWKDNVDNVYNFIRGLSPAPCAHTMLEFTDGTKHMLKVFKVEKHAKMITSDSGSFTTDNKTFFHIQATDGMISLKEIQLQGKRKMSIEDFLRGFDTTHIKALN